MLKLIWRILIILGTALGIAVLFYHAVNAGWVPGITSRFPLGEGSRVESALEERSSFRTRTAPNRNVLPFRPEFGDRDFEGRDFRSRSSITLGLTEMLHNLSVIALVVGVVIAFKYLLRFAQRMVPRRL
ncbi:MAG: hypothetical protein N3A60_00970 [Thermanaerothrix sp.]|nr:hypothetical protein [Thermanaerothrix sp.]